jgi:sugar O-acyltransferase (sialic acid O-acetyltransferase NeuD family)
MKSPMRKKMVIFGAAEQAEVSHYYFDRDSQYEVMGFIVDDDYLQESVFLGLPVAPWSQALQIYPPSEFECFVALGYTKVNVARKEIYSKVRKSGYKCPTYVSSRAVILNDSNIGDNCLILENNTIQPFAKIGSNTTIWSGNHIGHHTIIGNHVFVTSHVVISGGVSIDDQCFIGVNATIRDHVTIGMGTVIGAGSLIMKSTDPFSVYVPQPTQPRASNSNDLRRI